MMPTCPYATFLHSCHPEIPFFQNPTNNMDDVSDMPDILKENLWRKNELAHQRMRTKPSNGIYCTYCHHRNCGDPNVVQGNRSLKKSKICAWRTTKIDRDRWFLPSYFNLRNGEVDKN